MSDHCTHWFQNPGIGDVPRVGGVMFSLDTETGFKDVVFINGAPGLGENIVQGTIDPDSFYVHKPTFEKGYRAVLKRRPGRKQQKIRNLMPRPADDPGRLRHQPRPHLQ